MISAGPVLWIILAGILIVTVLLVVAGMVLRSAVKNNPGNAVVPTNPQLSLTAPKDSAVESSFESGLQSLRQRVLGGSFQYRVPWILMIGTPGSGKTAILDSLSSGALAPARDLSLKGLGIGWGFLNNGVVIDAPGSLLLGHGTGEQSDESGWNQMLRRLNRHRPARPLDGVVLTVSAAELLDSTVDIASRGALIRAKLDQLQSAAGLVLPVYVLVTKCDSIRGFGSFCEELRQTDPEVNKQIFGWSNDHTLESVFTWVWVDEAFTTLHRTLRTHQLRCFGADRAQTRADELFRFPTSFQALREPLRNLLTQLFVPVSYRDSHYFRGVYFCGLPSEPTMAAAGTELSTVAERGRTRLPLFFLEHLFDKKVFVEKTLARPVPQRFFFKNRIVIGAQIFSAAFSLIMAIGLTVAWFRLNEDKKHRIEPAIRSVERGAQMTPTMDGAYTLVQTLADLHTRGFRSVFIPASWNDPLEGQIEALLARGFENVVLGASQVELGRRYEKLLEPRDSGLTGTGENNCGEGSGSLDTARLNPADEARYQVLRTWLLQLSALEQHVNTYQHLSASSSGSYAALKELIEYLSGKTLSADDGLRDESYFSHAIQSSHWKDVNGLGSFRRRSVIRGRELIEAFYNDWFNASVLARRTGCVREDLNALEMARIQSSSQLRIVAGRISALHRTFSENSLEWLEQPFGLHQYGALSQLDAPELRPVFDQDFKDQREAEGRDAQQHLRTSLTEAQTPLTGPLLETSSAGKMRLSSAVYTVGTNLDYLAGQDFMAVTNVQPPVAPQAPVVWNPDLLNEALRLNESWDKYQHDALPTLPASVRPPVKAIAQHNLVAGMASLVLRARTPIPSNIAVTDALLVELKSFNLTLDKRKQLEEVAQNMGPPGGPLITSLNLYRQALRLLGSINSRLSSGALYSYNAGILKNWNGDKPMSLALYDAEAPDVLADGIAADHERLKKLVEYAAPLVQLISEGGLPLGDERQTVYWGKLGIDFRLFSEKKPGNPIAALEAFLRQDIDKITPENRCQGGLPDPRTADPFVNEMNSLRTSAVRSCLGMVRQRYITLADNFRQHLAGRFPFSPETMTSAEADPRDVEDFFELYDQSAPGLPESLDRLGALDANYKAPAQQAVAFLKALSRVRPLFATADRNSLPALDVTVQFRTNQTREAGGNQIIDWELRIGDQMYSYQAPPRALRWHYGDRLSLTMRYAKDSPRIPVARGTEHDAQIGDRRVIYDVNRNWSLLALLVGHAASATDFDNPLAPPANTIRLTFGNAPASPGAAGAGMSGSGLPDTVVFVGFDLQSPAAKEVPAKEGAARNSVAISSFPSHAPVIP